MQNSNFPSPTERIEYKHKNKKREQEIKNDPFSEPIAVMIQVFFFRQAKNPVGLKGWRDINDTADPDEEKKNKNCRNAYENFIQLGKIIKTSKFCCEQD